MRKHQFIGALGALVFAAAPALAGPQVFPPNGGGQIDFATPSQNIGCIYTPQGGSGTYVPADGGPELQCDRVLPTYLRFTLSNSGAASVSGDVADASCCGSANILQYGSTWSEGPYVCKSSSSGLTCTRGSHGFQISKAVIEAH